MYVYMLHTFYIYFNQPVDSCYLHEQNQPSRFSPNKPTLHPQLLHNMCDKRDMVSIAYFLDNLPPDKAGQATMYIHESMMMLLLAISFIPVCITRGKNI